MNRHLPSNHRVGFRPSILVILRTLGAAVAVSVAGLIYGLAVLMSPGLTMTWIASLPAMGVGVILCLGFERHIALGAMNVTAGGIWVNHFVVQYWVPWHQIKCITSSHVRVLKGPDCRLWPRWMLRPSAASLEAHIVHARQAFELRTTIRRRMHPWPIRLDETVHIRPWVPTDEAAFLNIFQDGEVTGRHHLGRRGVRQLRRWFRASLADRNDAVAYIWRLALVEMKDQSVLGHLDVWLHDAQQGWCEIAYGIKPAWRRQGYTTQAVHRVITPLMSVPGVTRVLASTAGDNHASMRLLERLGFMPFEERVGAEGSNSDPTQVTGCRRFMWRGDGR
ncbi:MAG: GNAT family N-acetyltransferase [Myxococcota bacterium]|nr:GNAT family N-acetyltransferase [Myxococcota bacterium]